MTSRVAGCGASPARQALLGDEAVALGALHSGIAAAYGYPGTPSTEILEFILRHAAIAGAPAASWCANEKTALEAALGVSLAGRRSLVCMKHVGLNVAADPFVNAALVAIRGGLVVAVADDPGMHSSQNEQDSRFYADFARTICLEPSDQQEAYDWTREAFEVSERFHVPVLLRLVTRLAHSRASVRSEAPRPDRPPAGSFDPTSWTLLPSNARRRWRSLIDRQEAIRRYVDSSPCNVLTPAPGRSPLGVVTAGIARNYFLEVRGEMEEAIPHLHVGAYPVPEEKARSLAAAAASLLVLEDGHPFVESRLRGVLPSGVEVRGRESGHLPPDGELSPDRVRRALGLPARPGLSPVLLPLPARPPQLCPGCPHRDTFEALRKALEGSARPVVTSDIGCYTLGALPPYRAIDSCVCMGASIGMARGAAEAGLRPAVAVIGDSTFLHSGVTPLMDAVAASADVTVLILDNGVVAMTGAQPTLLPGDRIESIVLALGVPRARCRVVQARPAEVDSMAAIIRQELREPGPSVIICRRECVESARRRKARGRASGRARRRADAGETDP